jgi:hypothetical protein
MHHVVTINGQAKEIGGHEAPLTGMQADDADDDAVRASDEPALPHTPSDHDRRKNREQAR